MVEGGTDNRMRNVTQYLRRVRDGIPPRSNGHTIVPEDTSSEGRHGEKQKRFVTKRKQ